MSIITWVIEKIWPAKPETVIPQKESKFQKRLKELSEKEGLQIISREDLYYFAVPIRRYTNYNLVYDVIPSKINPDLGTDKTCCTVFLNNDGSVCFAHPNKNYNGQNKKIFKIKAPNVMRVLEFLTEEKKKNIQNREPEPEYDAII